MRSFDVVIVGAGPAGATAARAAAEAGARVALVDGSHPREKPCGGGLTRRALQLTPPAVQSQTAVEIRGARFEVDVDAVAVPLQAGGTRLRVMSRRTFDQALVDAAARAGATLVGQRATAVARHRDGWTVHLRDGVVTGSWLLGADGPSGIVRRQVFRPFARRQLSIAAGAFVEGATAREVAIAFLDEPRGYLWSFPRPDHLAVGACAAADVATPAALHAVTDRWLDQQAGARGCRRRRYAWPIPSLGPADFDGEQPSGDRWLLLGDAAGLVDPITREGIYFAIRSGLEAAAALRGPDPARRYAEAIRHGIHSELRRAARFEQAVFRPRFTRLLLRGLVRSERIREVMRDLIAGEQSYRGLRRRLLATCEIGLMWSLLHSRD
ncbi:MAG TPA: NAD(P)/FAD-dependent oxidoreductase [Vicinamibacterales bacterium]|nr:NAD(P)/FAD-dependent oxidoreductase [Vicinamibacterales bacterium]